MIVIDASAAIELILRTELGERVELRALDPDERLHVPNLLDLEVARVLRRLTHLKEITTARALEALDDYAGLLVERSAHTALPRRVWELRDSMTAYDGAYVALAEALDARVADLVNLVVRLPMYSHRLLQLPIEPNQGGLGGLIP